MARSRLFSAGRSSTSPRLITEGTTSTPLAPVIRAVPRCSGSGRGPRRGIGGMRRSLGGLYCRRNLRVRGREETGDLLGERLIGRQSRQLALPKIEVAPRQPVEFGRRIVV